MQKPLYKDLYDQEETHWWHIAKRKNVVMFAKNYLKTKNPIILDIGCGAGKNIEAFSEIGNVWGIDMSTEAIKYCQKRGLKKIKKSTAEKTGFPNNKFDLITMLDVLEHTDDKATLKEVKRILKPKGLVIITVPAYKFLWSKWDEILHHKRRYTKYALNKELQKNGFDILKISYTNSFLLPAWLIIRPLKSLLKSNDYTSDFEIVTPFINSACSILANIERYFVQKEMVPFGLSLITVARLG